MNFMRIVHPSRGISCLSVKQISEKTLGKEISVARSYHLSKIKECSTKEKPNLSKFSGKRKPDNMNPIITLLTTDSGPTVIKLEQAQRIAMRRDLKLVQVMDVDHKSQRPVYKLMTGAEYFEEDFNRHKQRSLKKNVETKDPKLMILSYKISDHDLASKIKNIIKWLNKRHEIRVTINAPGNIETAERIYTTIETETKHAGKLVQKRSKGDDLKFQLLPSKKPKIDPDGQFMQESNDEIRHTE